MRGRLGSGFTGHFGRSRHLSLVRSSRHQRQRMRQRRPRRIGAPQGRIARQQVCGRASPTNSRRKCPRPAKRRGTRPTGSRGPRDMGAICSGGRTGKTGASRAPCRLASRPPTTRRPNFKTLSSGREAAAQKIDLDEAATRQIVDQQLRDRGWEADSQTADLCRRHPAGQRPGHGDRRMADRERAGRLCPFRRA